VVHIVTTWLKGLKRLHITETWSYATSSSSIFNEQKTYVSLLPTADVCTGLFYAANSECTRTDILHSCPPQITFFAVGHEMSELAESESKERGLNSTGYL
jgi:hypothetical protein